MSSNSTNKQSVFEPVRMPSPKSRRATIILKVLEHEAELAQAAKERAESRPASVPLPDNGRIDFGSYRPSPVHFTIRPTPKYGADELPVNKPLPAANEPLPAADEPLPAADEPLPSADEPLPAADEPLPAADEPSTTAEQSAGADEPSTTDEQSAGADEPLPAADEPSTTAEQSAGADEPLVAEAKPPRKVVSRREKFWRALKRQSNLAKRAKWTVQFPKRVVPTSNGGHLVLSNHTKREGEKLINAIKREHRPRKKPSWLKPSTN